jgi:hypothetical protein
VFERNVPSVRPGPQPVHVAIIKREYKGKLYSYPLLRQSFREDGKVKHRTLANLSALPSEVVELIRAALSGQRLVPLAQVFNIERSYPHGHVAAVLGCLRKLEMERLLYLVADRQRPLVMAMIAAQILQLQSKLASVGLLERTGLLLELGVKTKVDQDDLYLAMDELLICQEMIERRLAERHLKPGDLCLYDRSSAVYTGRHCELAEHGYSRDGRRNSLQVTFGLPCDREGRPLSLGSCGVLVGLAAYADMPDLPTPPTKLSATATIAAVVSATPADAAAGTLPSSPVPPSPATVGRPR